ncbi:hypothetical protein B2J88_07980 [Rhodococcus sp. SRB_17]|nr:hypothetical protein [Rhodococcus sp. SRB_17]
MNAQRDELGEELTTALQAAARKEILRKPSSAAQFATQTKETQTAVVDAFAAWALKAILPIIESETT